MATREEVEAQLATVFEELIDLIGEAKQAAWTALPPERRTVFDDLRAFLVEQAGVVDEAELRLGERPAWVRNPTGHHWRNISSEARGDPDLLVAALTRDIDATIDDIREHATTLEGEPRRVLDDVADALAARVQELRPG
jgi:hypothetical protein